MFVSHRPLKIFAAAILAAILSQASVGVYAQSAPIITGDSSALSGSTLTIVGQNFGTTPATVHIDSIPAPVVSWSNTSITVNLPAAAGPGTLTVATSTGLSTSIAFTGVERGYYLLSANGAVSAEGGATSYGDLTTIHATGSPAVQLVPTTNNQGYWILTQNGSVYAFGDAQNFGSVTTPIGAVSLAVLPSGAGAYVLSATGQVYPLGQAQNYGQPSQTISAVSIATTSTGLGYWILGSDGTVYAFGDASQYGAASSGASLPHSTRPANHSLVKLVNTGVIFEISGNTLYHIPNIAMLKSMGRQIGAVRTVQNLSGYTVGLPLVVPYPDGTVLQTAAARDYWVQGGVVHPLPVSVAHILGLSLSQSVRVSGLRPNWPTGPAVSAASWHVPTGWLYRIQGQPLVAIVEHGTLRPIATGAEFRAMGLKSSDIHVVRHWPHLAMGSPLSAATLIPVNGTLWHPRTGVAVYVAQNGVFRQVPTAVEFHKLGYTISEEHQVASLSNSPIGTALGSAVLPPAGQTAPATATPASPAVSLVPTADSLGYWILSQNGTITPYGDAPPLPEPSALAIGTSTALSLAVTPDQNGAAIVLSNGSVLPLGDAAAVPLTTPGLVNLAMIAGAPAPPGFMSFAYGDFMPHFDGSYGTIQKFPGALSAIVPTWYYLSQNPKTLSWSIGQPPRGSQTVVALAHSQNIQVWPMFGTIAVAPYQTPAHVSAVVRQIVNAAVANGYDGVTIDFEPGNMNGLSKQQVMQLFTNFVSTLGYQLQQAGKGLMVDVYPFGYPVSSFNLPALAANVTYLNIMSYGENDSFTQAGPTQALPWDQHIYQAALAQGVPPQKLIMGLGPYGDYWSFNNQGLNRGAPLGSNSFVSDAQVQRLLALKPTIAPIWDPAFGSEVFMTNEFVNSQGQWTANASGSAVAPTYRLIPSLQSKWMGQVQNLQGLLNYILLRYAVENHQPVPAYLNQNGYYDTATQNAVTQFQRDFSVAGAIPKIYGPSTQAALKSVINRWGLGEYQYWVGNTVGLQNRIQNVALANHLAGVAIWRAPFETNGYWSMLTSTVQVSPHGN